MERVSRKYKNTYKDISYRWEDDLKDLNLDDWKKEVAYSCSPYTVTHLPAVVDLINTVEQIIIDDIPGDFVECGVFMGGSCMIIAEVLKHYNTTRPIWLYDTFEGVPMPEKYEVTPEGTSLRKWYKQNKLTPEGSMFCYCNLEDVTDNFKTVGYTGEKHFVKGKVEDTIPDITPKEIALLRIDVDLAKPTRHVLEHMYPLVVDCGHIIFDDYGHFPAVKETVDDYLGNVTLEEITYTVRHLVK